MKEKMRVYPHPITVRELIEGYVNKEEENEDEGIYGYGGKLNIRPPYQREFIYNDKERKAVIDTILKGFPLNSMYWNVCEDGTFEIMDGQQRTISICEYAQGDFGVKFEGQLHYFGEKTPKELKEQFLNYELNVYCCIGTESERMGWFQTINIAGKELKDQELRNAVYYGPFTSDARRTFSKTNGGAYELGKPYIGGDYNRQAFLERALEWFVKGKGEKIDEYMSKHRNDPNANALWFYFRDVLDWVNTTFRPTKLQQKIMKDVDWGYLYDNYHTEEFNLDEVNKLYKKLLKDVDEKEITKKNGIYPYIITGNESYLSLRQFSEEQKSVAYENQKGICKKCKKHFEIEQMEADHIIPWSKGGKTVQENCQCLCRKCNRVKSDK